MSSSASEPGGVGICGFSRWKWASVHSAAFSNRFASFSHFSSQALTRLELALGLLQLGEITRRGEHLRFVLELTVIHLRLFLGFFVVVSHLAVVGVDILRHRRATRQASASTENPDKTQPCPRPRPGRSESFRHRHDLLVVGFAWKRSSTAACTGAGSVRQPIATRSHRKEIGQTWQSQSSTPRQTLGAWTTSRSVDHLEGRVKIGLDGQVGHDHQRHGALLGGVVAGVVLDHAGDADPLLAEDLGQPGQHAGPVGDREAEVIAALDLAGGRQRDRGGRFGPEVQTRVGRAARPVTTSIRSPTTAEAVGIAPAPRP